jgi:hypothetical protein
LASLLFICPAAFGSDGAANSLESALLAKYGKQVVTLRGFYQDKNLHFDSKGTVLDKVHPGSWTLSRMEIEKIRVSVNTVELSGPRLAEINTSKQVKLGLVPTKQQIHIVVDRDPSEPDGVVLQVIDQVFLNERDRVVDLVPDYWKAYLSGRIEVVSQDDGVDCYRIKEKYVRKDNGEVALPCETHKASKTHEETNLIPPTNISILPYQYGNLVTAPKNVFAPNPEYSGVARSLGIQGNVILEITVAVQGVRPT